MSLYIGDTAPDVIVDTITEAGTTGRLAGAYDLGRIVTPAEGRTGDKVIIPPSIPDAKAKDIFPQGFETIKPYLRMVQVD